VRMRGEREVVDVVLRYVASDFQISEKRRLYA
jgi:hypothetical protein